MVEGEPTPGGLLVPFWSVESPKKKQKHASGQGIALDLSPAEGSLHDKKRKRLTAQRRRAAEKVQRDRFPVLENELELKSHALELGMPMLRDTVSQLGLKLAAAERDISVLTKERGGLQLQVTNFHAYVDNIVEVRY